MFLELIRPDGKNPRLLKTLLDSGASAPIVSYKVVHDLDTERDKFRAFQTMAGTSNITHTCKTKFKVPELNQSEICKKLHVTQMNGRYNAILGQKKLRELGLVINFHAETVCWNDSAIDMKPPDCTQETLYFLNDTANIAEDTERMSKILDAKYTAADLRKVAITNVHLTNNQKEKLYALLSQHKLLFDGMLGKWEGNPYHIELQEGAKPYHTPMYSIPHAYKRTLRTEVDRLYKVRRPAKNRSIRVGRRFQRVK